MPPCAGGSLLFCATRGNAERGMRNGECGMGNAECGMGNGRAGDLGDVGRFAGRGTGTGDGTKKLCRNAEQILPMVGCWRLEVVVCKGFSDSSPWLQTPEQAEQDGTRRNKTEQRGTTRNKTEQDGTRRNQTERANDEIRNQNDEGMTKSEIRMLIADR